MNLLASRAQEWQGNVPMLTFIRNQSKYLMATLLVLIGLSFVVFYNIPSLKHLNEGQMGSIDGRVITVDEFKIQQQTAGFWMSLSYGGRLPNSGGFQQRIARQAWERMLVLAEADRMGILISDAQVISYIQALPFLQKDGHYQSAQYEQFVMNFLSPQGIGSQRFEEMVRENLMIEEWRKGFFASVAVSPSEVRELYQSVYGPVKMSMIRFDQSKYISRAETTPQEVEAEYARQSSNPVYCTPAKRKVAFVSFRLTPQELKLAAKEKEEAKAKLGEQAVNFSVALLGDDKNKPVDFEKGAPAFKGFHGTTDFFAETEAAKPLPLNASLNQAAFRLTREEPLSNLVEMEDGYCLLKLLEIQESQPLPLDKVRDKVVQKLKETKAMDLLRKEGAEMARQMTEAVSKGETLGAAAARLKLSILDVPEFSPAQPKLDWPETGDLVRLSRSLKINEISPFSPTAKGGVIAWVTARKSADEKELEKSKTMIEQMLVQQRQGRLYNDWIRAESKKKGNSLPSQLFGEASAMN